MISMELVTELKVILEEEYGIQLSIEETSEIANFLFSYFETLTRTEAQITKQ